MPKSAKSNLKPPAAPAPVAMTASATVMAAAPPVFAPAEPVVGNHRAALMVLQPQMALVPKEAFLTTRVDVERAATGVLGRSKSLVDRGTPSQLAALAAANIPSTVIEDSILAARACIALVNLERTADAVSSEAKLDPAIADESATRKARMLKMATYHFGDHAVHGPEIADIRQGSGHADTASDLNRLAALFEHPEVATIMAADRFYDPQDVPRSVFLSEEIYDRIGVVTAAKERSIQLNQAWVLLNNAWEQVRRVVQFLYWNDPAMIAQFPLIYSLGRSARVSTKTNTKDGPEADETIAPPAAATPSTPAPSTLPITSGNEPTKTASLSH